MGALIPLGDASRRPSRFPVITAAIILINAVIFVLELLGGKQFVVHWAAIPADIVLGRNWVTVLTAMFMHGSWSHIIGNMVFLWAFGPEIEDVMNPVGYLVFYLIGGIAAMAAQIAVSPHSSVPNLGASGAIAAVMGAFIVTYPRDKIRTLLVIFLFVDVTFIPASLLIGLWFLLQLLNAGAVAVVQSGGVAYMAHVGGFVFGAVTARLFEDSKRLAEQRLRRERWEAEAD